MHNICNATEADLETVLDWLKREYEEDCEGFWANRNIITDAQLDGELYILKDEGEPVALYVGNDDSMFILSVKKDCRGRGYGKELAEFAIQNVRSAGACVVEIKCEPITSIPFWKKMGFRLFAPHDSNCNQAYLIFEKSYELSPEAKKEKVTVRMYPESALDNPETKYLKEWVLDTVREKNDQLSLEKRVVFYNPLNLVGRDLVGEILVDGKQLIKDKVKRDEMEEFGVQEAPCGTYFIESVSDS